jgi:excisionase family DNA binding protein
MSIESCGRGRDSRLKSEEPIPLRAAYSPREAKCLLGVSHSTLYRLIASGRLDARKLLGKTVILATSIETLLASLPKSQSPRTAGGADGHG